MRAADMTDIVDLNKPTPEPNENCDVPTRCANMLQPHLNRHKQRQAKGIIIEIII